MRANTRIAALSACCLLLAACATSVRVTVTKPAEINMAGNRIVAVLDFRHPDSRGWSGADLFRWAVGRLLGIELYRDKSVERRVAEYATSQVIETLLDTGYFQLVGPAEVAAATRGRLDAGASPSQVGGAVRAQAIVYGELERLDSEEERWVQERARTDPATGAEIKEMVDMITRRVEVAMSYRVVNTESGLVVAARSFEGYDEVDVEASRRHALPAVEDMYKSVIDGFLPTMARQLAPHSVSERRRLLRDRSRDPRVAEGERLVRARAYEEALAVFLRTWEDSRHLAAGYDAAIVYEITGRLEQALAQMREVLRVTGDRRAARAAERLRAALSERERVIEQQG